MGSVPRDPSVQIPTATAEWYDEEDACSFASASSFPEKGHMMRVGNCVMEFAPSGSYVEDWRAVPGASDVHFSAALELVAERRVGSDAHNSVDALGKGMQEREGGLVTNGNHAMLFIGRPEGAAITHAMKVNGLASEVAKMLAAGRRQEVLKLLDFEGSYAVRHGGVGHPFVVVQSTHPWRIGSHLPDFRDAVLHNSKQDCGRCMLTQQVRDINAVRERVWAVQEWRPAVQAASVGASKI
eukprot:SAG31_NODE_3890_length_3777_cov_5.473355_4_plen_240_part_00